MLTNRNYVHVIEWYKIINQIQRVHTTDTVSYGTVTQYGTISTVVGWKYGVRVKLLTVGTYARYSLKKKLKKERSGRRTGAERGARGTGKVVSQTLRADKRRDQMRS